MVHLLGPNRPNLCITKKNQKKNGYTVWPYIEHIFTFVSMFRVFAVCRPLTILTLSGKLHGKLSLGNIIELNMFSILGNLL